MEQDNTAHPSPGHKEIASEIQTSVPLINNLLFSDGTCEASALPSIVGLVSSFFCQDTEDDACLVVPAKGDIALHAAVLSSLNSFQQNYKTLVERYLDKDLTKGDKVKVQPSGDIFEYGGYFAYNGQKYFKLNFLNDPNNGSRSFPLEGAIRLEKTNDTSPKGTGESLGNMLKSPLDRLVGSEIGGNRALLKNELIIITEMTRVKSFLKKYQVQNKTLGFEDQNDIVQLSSAVEIGRITSDGNLVFVDSDVKDGKPLIAVSRSLTDVANYCQINNMPKQKVIIDGASRTFEHLSDMSKILEFARVVVLSDHSETEQITQLSKMDCSVLNVNDQLAADLIENSRLMPVTSKKFYNSAHFEFTKHIVSSGELEKIYARIRQFDAILKSEDKDSLPKKIVKQFYLALMDLASLVGDQDGEEYKRIKQNLKVARSQIETDAPFLPKSFLEISAAILLSFDSIFQAGPSDLSDIKGEVLLQSVKGAISNQRDFVVLCRNQTSQKSASNLFRSAGYEDVQVVLADQLTGYTNLDMVILNGMPWARKLDRILSDHKCSEIEAVVYEFEYYSIKKRIDSKANTLLGWSKNTEELARHTGLPVKAFPKPNESQKVQANPSLRAPVHFDLDAIMSGIKKGKPVNSNDSNSADFKDCRYVGFTEEAYAYLSENFKVPVVTEFLNPRHISDQRRVRLKIAQDLVQGDQVVFRVSENRSADLIQDTARLLYGEENYDNLRKSSNVWKDVLVDQSLSYAQMRSRLSALGLTRTVQAIRGWMTSPYVIGVQEKKDLEIILSISSEPFNTVQVEEIWQAIRAIRVMHIQAGRRLQSLLAKNLEKVASRLQGQDTKRLNLKVNGKSLGRVEIVEVEDIAKIIERRPPHEIDKLLKEF